MPKIKSHPKNALTVRIAAETLQILDEITEEYHIPKSSHVQIALNEYLAKYYPKEHKRLSDDYPDPTA